MIDDTDDTRLYTVLMNDEGQYSLWLKERVVPRGWTTVKMEGTKSECAKYVDEVWTDMRPVSLRKQMDSSIL
jgi:MbtH protein